VSKIASARALLPDTLGSASAVLEGALTTRLCVWPRKEADMSDANESNAKAETPAAAPRPRGFAAMSPEERRNLGSKGGKTAHQRGTANKFTPETASVAGRRPHLNGTAHKWTSEEAREAGRKGGSALRRRRSQANDEVS
jgi:general stress protein YciG